jgi:hypothetical protein
MKLEVSLFRFDYKSDYLPYYTKNFIKIKNEKNLLDILNHINIEHPFGYEKSLDFCVCINGIYVNLSITIDEIVKNFGSDIIIEPISIRRAHTDLLINDADFQNRLAILSEFIEPSHKKIYESYKIYFYASNTINYEYDYIGDSILLLASNLIEEDASKQKDILKAISDYECSIEYHTSLEKRVYNFDLSIEDKIKNLKSQLNLSKELENQEYSIDKKSTILFEEFNESSQIKYDFNDFNIAYFKGLKEDTQTSSLLSKLNANLINTESMSSDLALDTFHINKDFTMRLASTVMLDAFDNSADLLVVDDEKVFNLFDTNRKSLEKVSGREIIIPVIHKSELAKLALGLHQEVKSSLKKHCVDPEII